MSEQFDGYYKWLGIPPKDQPPNYYRLLSIELYEDNPEVIEASAERQATYLHEVSSGPHVKESQKLLNEIAGARLCLLDTEKKAAYDEELRSKVTANVTVDALAGGHSPLDDLPWDNLEPLMTNGSSSDTAPQGQAASETLRLPAADPSGVFSKPKSLMAGSPASPAKPEAKTSRPAMFRIVIGCGVAIAIALAVLVVLRSNSGDDDGLRTSEQPQVDTPGVKTPLDSDKKDNQSEKKDGKPTQPVQDDTGNGNDGKNNKKDDAKKDSDKKPPKNNGNDTKQPVIPNATGNQSSNNTMNGGSNPKNGNGEKTGVAQQPIRTNEFQTLWPLEVTSLSGGTEFAPVANECVLARGNSDDDTYTIEAMTDVPGITSIKIEMLPHDGLPERGPGLDKDGGFSISELRVIAVPARNPDAANEVSESTTEKSESEKRREQRERLWWPVSPTAKYKVPVSGVKSEEAPQYIERLIDREHPYWPVHLPGKPTTLTVFLKTPIRHVGGTLLFVQLAQRGKIGHFRVSVSNDPDLAGRKTRIEAELPLFVNLGGKSTKMDAARRSWPVSPEFDGGSFGHVGGSVEGDDRDVPVTSCISGLKEFRVTLPDGKYNVLLLFNERCPPDASQRSFHVSASGIEKQTVKDIKNKRRQTFDSRVLNGVEAKNGGLIIQFASEKGEPFLNAIAIEDAE